MTTRILHRLTASAAALALAVAGLGAIAAPAGALSSPQSVTATANLTGGSLAFNAAPSAPAFTATLNGTDQTANSAQTIDVSDGTGSGAGWNLTATSTTFTAGAKTLTGSTTITSAPTVACDTNVTCTTATNSVSYSTPYSLPSAPTAPTATKFYNATANTGMGNQTVTPTWTLAIPANSYAANYSSTWTISLVSGP